MKGTPDRQKVSAEGQPVRSLIAGVKLRAAISHPDERGELTEIYDPGWQFSEAPLVYVYQTTVRPKKIRGWVAHKNQDDRIFVSVGHLRWVLFDDREDSPTRGLLNEIFITERNRQLLYIPHEVWHAVQNIGEIDALFLNLPTRPYDHAAPDKYRLPLGSPSIPYDRWEDLGR